MIRLCLIPMMAVIHGCAVPTYSNGTQSAGPGQAVYHYKKSGDSCEVVITSAREVPGIEAKVDRHCAVTVKAESLSGDELQLKTMSIVDAVLKKIP